MSYFRSRWFEKQNGWRIFAFQSMPNFDFLRTHHTPVCLRLDRVRQLKCDIESSILGVGGNIFHSGIPYVARERILYFADAVIDLL
jgi:hypothetical protein